MSEVETDRLRYTSPDPGKLWVFFWFAERISTPGISIIEERLHSGCWTESMGLVGLPSLST
jgi:hypothetical protein